MTNDKMNFSLTCPVCGATDHEVYDYKGNLMLACPKANDKVVVFPWSWPTETSPAKEDKGYCGLEPLETGEQDPYWRDGVCKQHDERFIKRNKSTWVVTRDFVTGATKTMLRGAWAVVGYPFYVLIGGIGGAIRYKFGGKK